MIPSDYLQLTFKQLLVQGTIIPDRKNLLHTLLQVNNLQEIIQNTQILHMTLSIKGSIIKFSTTDDHLPKRTHLFAVNLFHKTIQKSRDQSIVRSNTTRENKQF